MTEPINPLDTVLPYIASAVGKWKQENTEERIKATVTNLLNKESEEIMLKLLGFDNRYGKWELDRCNGRAGESAAGDYLRKNQQEAIQEFLKTVAMPALNAALKKNLVKSLADNYQDVLQRELRDLTYAKAKRDAADLIEAVVGSKQIDNYLKVMQLINPKEPV